MSLSKPKSQNVSRNPKIEKIVADYLTGGNQHFEALRVIVQPMIKYIVHAKASRVSREERQDLVQECWLKVLKNLASWDPARGTLNNFLFSCFSNRMICLHRTSTKNVFNSVAYKSDYENSAASQDTIDSDLNIKIETRFTEPAEVYILQSVGVAMYLRTYDTHRRRMHRNLYKMTGLSRDKVEFLMNYAVCKIRKFCLEQKWKIETQNAR